MTNHTKIADLELFSTLYSVNAKVYEKDFDGNWIERILPIKSHESHNSDFLRQWEKVYHKGLLVKILTSKSKCGVRFQETTFPFYDTS